MADETITYTAEQLREFSEAELNNVLMNAVKIEGVVCVRDKDGNPKYDNPELAGTYGEFENE